LLPTIRSRVVSLRVNRVPDDVVAAFLEAIGVPASPARARRVLLAEGSIGRALWSGDGVDAAEAAADRFLAAVRGGPAKWALAAISQHAWAGRGEFTAMLDGGALRLRARVVEPPQQRRATPRRYLPAF